MSTTFFWEVFWIRFLPHTPDTALHRPHPPRSSPSPGKPKATPTTWGFTLPLGLAMTSPAFGNYGHALRGIIGQQTRLPSPSLTRTRATRSGLKPFVAHYGKFARNKSAATLSCRRHFRLVPRVSHRSVSTPGLSSDIFL